MWIIFNITQTDPSLKVKQSYFRNVFNTKYNIGFGKPRVDVCSRCTEFKEKIKTSEGATKQSLMTLYKVHTRKAKAFYEILKEERADLLTISFDCQKSMMLPELPDQSAFQ